MPPCGFIQLSVPIFTCESSEGSSYVSPCKIRAISDYPRLSYRDLTNLSKPLFAILDFRKKVYLDHFVFTGPRYRRAHHVDSNRRSFFPERRAATVHNTNTWLHGRVTRSNPIFTLLDSGKCIRSRRGLRISP